MKQVSFSVPPAYDGVSCRGFLRSFAGCSARLLTAAKRMPRGLLKNGEPATARTVLSAGDVVTLTVAPAPCTAEPVELSVPVVWEDESVLVMEKPSGMPMYPCPGHDCDSLANAVCFLFSRRGETPEYHPVYRLDRDTTGLVVMGKDSFAASRLAGRVEKEYRALCEGELLGEGTFDGPIGLLPGHTIQRCVRPDGERAVTHWRSLAVQEGFSLVSFSLETGRTHQIRVHMAHAGHPLLGDDMYGGPMALLSRQALHCARVAFAHPVTGESLLFTSSFPPDMAALLVLYNR